MVNNSGIGKKLKVANLILKKTDSMFEKLQYKFAIAIEYYIVNDIESSTEIADEVIEKLEECRNDVEDIFELNKMAEIYEIYAGLFDKETYYEKALDLYILCEKSGQLNTSGYSMIYRNMAYIYLKQQLYTKSIQFFEKSYEFESNNFSLIYIVENLLYLEKLEDAKVYIDMIERDNLGVDIVDYYTIKAEYTICSGDADEMKKLIKQMQEIDISKMPFYNDIFSKLIIEMQKSSGGLRGFLSAIKKYS